ncbi:hypothetical protein PR202_gb25041 [Eleusine coracana subsp. coracana]|uniref:Uncharacterized protein n=1 Tax=Eleusine coracana subsp. coracana TaxID=191504 RepID=A0AAV5FN58_ELECO|nr:hypothetical protein PR202_gb25041 [Eleusine coracana subsp. coracana]
MKQEELDIPADLPRLHYLKLRHQAYSGSKLTFQKDELKNLKYILVEGSNITNISFDGGAPELEKIVLPFTGLKLNGILDLLKLKEVELTYNTSSTNNNSSDINSRGSTSLSIFKDATQIAKMTLRGTRLKQDDLRDFANKSNISCLMMLDHSYAESELTFNEDELLKLNLLILNCSNINNISFHSGSAPKINKIVWSFKEMKALSGINNLQRLRELEFNGDHVLTQLRTLKERRAMSASGDYGTV